MLKVVCKNSAKLDTTSIASLLSLRTAGTAMDLTTAYRYNQNMMEYYTCKLFNLDILHKKTFSFLLWNLLPKNFKTI